MGKGDKRSRRGKIFAGSYGKSRPKRSKPAYVPSESAREPSSETATKPRVRVRKKAEA